MKILIQSNAPWSNTGYGVQIKHLVPRLEKAGHEVAIFSFYGLQGGMTNVNGYMIYPPLRDPFGQDVISQHMDHFGGDVLISLMDVWTTQQMGSIAKRSRWNWLPWTPIDAVPIPQLVKTALDGAHTILPYSKFGESSLIDSGYENVFYVPHGFSENYCPGSKEESRKALGLPEDAFIIGMVAANKDFPPRKSFPQQMIAFKSFLENHPGSILYLHTIIGPEDRGVDILALGKELGIIKSMIWTNQYQYSMGLPEVALAHLYRSFDILTSTSRSEGFCIPLIEAQACGTPVVVSDFTSMPELVRSGKVVKKGMREWTPLNVWHFIPDPEAIAAAYEELYEELSDETSATTLKEGAVKGVSGFKWDAVVENYWLPLLASI